MKILLVSMLLILIFQRYETIVGWFEEPVDYSSLTQQDIVMYSTSWCSYCAQARRFFNKNTIPYTEYDIEHSETGKQQFQALNGGAIPLIVIRGSVVHGYDLKLIKHELNKIVNFKKTQIQ